MTLRHSKPHPWVPKGLTESVDGSLAFQGAMLSLQNLIPDPGTDGIWQCRPASLELTTFPGFTTPGFISCLFSVGSWVYGMIATGRNPGQDEPFAYNVVTGLFAVITGVTGANSPASPPTSGVWTPPTMALIGGKIIITHPGYNHGAGFDFGVLDVNNPAAPTYTAQTLTGAVVLPALPTVVAQFNGRAWYAVGNAVVFSDTTSPTNCTLGTQVVTFGTNQPINAMVGLPLTSTQFGGIIQALIVFIASGTGEPGGSTIYQIYGDAASTSNPLATNNLNVETGTFSQNSVCATPQGLAFVSFEGIRFINFQAQVSDPITNYGKGISRVFFYASVPSRVAMAYVADVFRVSLNNSLAPGSPNQEYFYHLSGKRWSGPHTFPASLIQQSGSTFVMAPIGVTGSLWMSNAIPATSNTYTENGTPMQWQIATPLLPFTSDMAMHSVIEQTINLALNAMDPYQFSFQNEQGAILGTATITGTGTTTIWGAFLWGGAVWGGSAQAYSTWRLKYANALVFKRAFFSGFGPSSAGFRIGGIDTKIEELGYVLAA